MEDTTFSAVYNRFLGKITDDMYIELTPQDTIRDLQMLLTNAITRFEFPRKNLEDYTIEVTEMSQENYNNNSKGFVVSSTSNESGDSTVIVDNSHFNMELTPEEIDILALLMEVAWVQRQVASIENTRMKYSGSDFKMTSQANHLSKLIMLLHAVERQCIHAQRLYKRRRPGEDGVFESNWSVLRESALDD